MKTARPFLFFVVIVMIVSLACSFGANNNTQAPANTPQPVVDKPTATEEKPQPASDAVSNLDDLRDAVIQIEAVGTFVDPQVGLLVNAAGRGSGFIIDPSGLAVTNNHVVTGAATLKVFINGQQYSARVLGASECADLAVIKIEGSNFKYLDWFTGDVKVGAEVYSAGFPLGEPQFTLTKGIISKEKADGHTDWASLDYVLSHDATINPGNSGGPLITKDAQVVGVNYRSRPNFNQYFAIDAKTAQKMITDLQTGKDVWSIGVNGVAVRSEDGSLSGIWVMSVKSGTPADKAGVKPGDILFQMEGLVLGTDGTMKDYCDILRSRSATDTMSLTVIRFATGEILEGQLNGRELAVTGNFGTGGGSGSSGNSGSGSGSQGAYFTEEFDSDPQWEYTVIQGRNSSRKENARYTFSGGRMIFDITDPQLYAYYIYPGHSYSGVVLDILVDNRGVNSQQVSLICNLGNDGWYEWAIQSDGLWVLYYVTQSLEYNLVANGGSTAIKQGKSSNQYTLSCQGNEIAFAINGVQPKQSPVTDRKYALREGQVGFSISSLNSTPVKIEVEAFRIEQP